MTTPLDKDTGPGPAAIELDAALAGKVLAAAILDAAGGVLLPASSILTEQNIGSLLRRGIDSVFIVDESADLAGAALRTEQQLARLEHLFRGSPPGSAAEKLKLELAAYRAGGSK